MSTSAEDPSPDEAERHGLCDAARRLIEQIRLTRAPQEQLLEARAALERVSELLAPFAHRGPLSQGGLDGGLGALGETLDPMRIFPFSPLIGRSNPISPPIELWVREGVVHGRARFTAPYCGPPNHVHGGVVAAVFDELLGTVNVVNGLGAMTGTLTVRYRKPTPLLEEVRLEGHSSGVEGRKVYAHGSLWHGDVLLAEAEGIFILVGEATFPSLQSS